ncbi:hypothetical protein [Kribbella sp. DT2]|uniref:hypothetical protein n=1 Tax=Kribbella sp. DT2 TaxID=3393427 RepID=UPI003CF54529
MQQAAGLCTDVVTDGWRETVADQANEYITEPTWNRLFRDHRKKHCKALARLAQGILDAKDSIHQLIGRLTAKLLARLGLGKVEQTVASELMRRIPLPTEARWVATARGLQVAGVLLCLANGDDLTRCQCFIELALEHTKETVKRILTTALEDWAQLAQFVGKRPATDSPV